jgi:hypothetical protein
MQALKEDKPKNVDSKTYMVVGLLLVILIASQMATDTRTS